MIMATEKKKDVSAKSDDEKYKYHQSQMSEDKDENKEYPDKPKNHTSTDERLLNPDRGEK